MTYQTLNPQQSSRLDAVLTHKIWGLPIFLGILWIMFQTTFVVGQIPMNWIDEGVHVLNNGLKNSMNESWFKSLLTDGIITGVGGVLIFLPNILNRLHPIRL